MRTFSKTLLPIPIAILLLSAAAWSQALPDAPAPLNTQAPAPPDAQWTRIQHFSDGQWIVVRTTSGVRVRCRFAGATDVCLFCDPPGPRPSRAGYQFDRPTVVSALESHPEINWHPVLLSAMAIVGTAIGIAATQSMDDRDATAAGLLSAGFIGLIGFSAGQFPMQRPYGDYGYGFGIAFRPHRFDRGAAGPLGPRSHLSMPIRPRR